jgi:hypothetical protein
MEASIRQTNNRINRSGKAILANVIGVCTLYFILSDLASGQTSQSGDCFIESRFVLLGNVVANTSSLFSEQIYIVVKAVSQLAERRTFDPRAKAAHESLKFANAASARALRCVLGGFFTDLLFASGLQNVEAVADRTARKGRDKDSDVLAVWHIVWTGLSGCLGWIAYGIVREWRLRREERNSLEKPYPNGGNTAIFYMTYIV